MTDDVIAFSAVSKLFHSGGRTVTAIGNLSFAVTRGEYVCVVGRSGGGKSTMLALLLGIEEPTSGSVRVLGLDPARQFDGLKGAIGCVFQTDRLLPWRSAVDNVRLPLQILGIGEGRLAVQPRDWLARLGLQGYEELFPHQLSGGMRQRVALARALAASPQVVLADESFGHLDEVTARDLRRDFRSVTRETGTTVVHVTHSIEEAVDLADRILVVGRPGRLVADIPLGPDADASRTDLRRRIFDLIEASDSPAGRVPEKLAS